MANNKNNGISSSHGALAGNTTTTNANRGALSGNTYGSGTKNVTSLQKTEPKASSPVTSNSTNSNANNAAVTDNTYNGGTPAEWQYNYGTEDTSNDYWEAYLDQMAKAEAQQKAAIQAAVDQSVNSLNSQKTTTAQDYADAYRQLYLNNMKSQKNIGQQMAAQGVTGGASESTLLGLNTNYEDNLRQGKVAEQNALSALDQAIIDAQLSGSIEAANANATNAQNTANAYLTAWQQDLANKQTQAQLKASQDSENRSYAYQIAMAMLQGGSMPSDTLLNSAGISKADANTIVAQYVASKAKTGRSGSSGSSDSTGTSYGAYGNNGYGDAYDEILSYAQALANRDGRPSSALAYLKDAYNSSVFESISGNKKNAYDAMIASINGMF